LKNMQNETMDTSATSLSIITCIRNHLMLTYKLKWDHKISFSS
jgi:hypothetical protein